MSIADKLTELQETKTAIKTAIEGKLGENALANVPFTGYAEKITAIQGGGGIGGNEGGGVTHTNGTQTLSTGKYTIQIAHGLGKKPKFAVCFADDYATISGVKTGCGFIYSEMMGISLKNFTTLGNFVIYGITIDDALSGTYSMGRVYADDTYIYCEQGDSNWRGRDYNWEAVTW